jgi:hypothetical protein
VTAANNHAPPATILVIDIGGSHVKILVTGETEPRTCPSGKRMTPTQMVAVVHELAQDWTYEAISHWLPGHRRGPRPALRAGQPWARVGGLQLRGGL